MKLSHEDFAARARVYPSYAMRDAVAAYETYEYRAMLARCKVQSRVRDALIRDGAAALLDPRPQAGGCTKPIFPRGFVNVELETGETFRVRHEAAAERKNAAASMLIVDALT